MSSAIHIVQHIPSTEALDEVIELFIEAFKPKLIHLDFMTRDIERIRRALRDMIEPEHAFYAVENGHVIGFLALEDGERGEFFTYSLSRLRRHFGLLGGLWRYFFNRITEGYRRHDGDTIRIDCIVVGPQARGKGVGTLLIEAAHEHAKRLGRKRIALEVIDTNDRAEALYKRLGYRLRGKKNYGPFTRRAGFTKLYLMDRVL